MASAGVASQACHIYWNDTESALIFLVSINCTGPARGSFLSVKSYRYQKCAFVTLDGIMKDLTFMAVYGTEKGAGAPASSMVVSRIKARAQHWICMGGM